ncbi:MULTISPECIES: exodeoxyribonuclease VII small subunit [Thalassolituus]|jgi:exodeoxyribonuclease VII small subunit|uniref:exodeoxyribonuclease VII small subunit n=1 Tax=Thalassolituus TaxID=187492 RepID=UPI000C0FF202|nr:MULTISPECIES: exodeoxyribonuclease VII small subunit [Thalassolituus]MAE35534.1 exodeoxyribonuclease VII small subunit [Oceanospirillaceae bacterium]MAX87759.1 exodeoxyribonuclease VII small subunit [Oceanospirillaceae bacterium]MBN59580.1 exodeoxyribonuclease VII small subunit [Oceanospirillaceae bacterium]MDQ4424835.1 exodeoxyribonuclease VII small subunit [Thalassolituus sp.]MDQ4426686.1 exodeoxyribonuclease VII small subunit [Thalassolituus sp.]|tara:strand:+ start:40 stop:285 length:246 start_codon:yes stop_codon:yes gene_type:complete
MSEKSSSFGFESALSELEALVTRMESGELTLEDSLEAFEKGIGLTRQCQQALTAAEQRVQLLMERNGQSDAQPFQGGDAGE